MTVFVFIVVASIARVLIHDDVDPITAFFDHDWASVGGWGLLFGFLIVWVGIGSFKEWWVPGPRYRRDQILIAQQQALLLQQSAQITKLTDANELTKYVIEQVVPRPSIGGRGSTVAPSKEDGSTS